MHEYDSVLKLLLRTSARRIFDQTISEAVIEWLDVELPKAQQPRVDLLGETESGALEQIEMQSRNDPLMAIRMLEYRLGIYRHFGQFPRQTVLYVGKEKLRMPGALMIDRLSFDYNLVDVSTLEGEPLLASEHAGDNVLAILTRVPGEVDLIGSIVSRIARLDSPTRQDTMGQLLIISGLRGLEGAVEEARRKMPITEDILNHKVIGPVYKKGVEEGLAAGLVKGRAEGERVLLQTLLEKRFGALPAFAVTRLAQSSVEALERIGLKLLDASNLEDVFR